MFVNISEEMAFYFSNNVDKACSHWLKISWSIGMKPLFHFTAYFHVLGTFHISYHRSPEECVF